MNPEPPIHFEEAARQLTPELLSRFRQALELGRWPDGRAVTEAQKTLLMETILIAEAARNLPEEQRTGYIDRSRHPRRDDSDVIHRE